MTYLRVRNWDRFQHYKNRRPPWIKFYVELLDDYELTALPLEAQFVYDRLLLLAAKHENAIPNDSEWISKQMRIETEIVTNAVALLLKGRWLSQSQTTRRASKTLATRKQNAMPETETEKDPPTPIASGDKNGQPSPRARGTSPRQLGTNQRSQPPTPSEHVCDECGRDYGTAEYLEAHRENVHLVTVPADDPDDDLPF